jgi:hypothetical protein
VLRPTIRVIDPLPSAAEPGSPSPATQPSADSGDADLAAPPDNVRRLPSRADDQFFDQEAPENREPSGAAGVPAAGPAPVVGLLGHAEHGEPATVMEAAPITPLSSFFAQPEGGDTTAPDVVAPDGRAPDGRAPDGLAPDTTASGGVAADDATNVTDKLPPPPVEDALDALFPPPAGTPQPAAEDDERRARIPSWDDILLGVRRKRD